MKVILLQDVANVGRRFDVVEVPNGYALNQLIPRGKAEAATAENLRRLASRAAQRSAQEVSDTAAFRAAVEQLRAEPLEVAAAANEQQHLFEAVKPAAVIAAAQQRGLALTDENLRLPEPIKTLGEHSIQLTFGKEAETVTLRIIPA